MSSVTSYMGLTKWDNLNDKFSHAQLAANFQAIDEHDHSPTKGKQIPAGGIAPLAIGPGNIQDGAFTAAKIGDDAITADKIADGAVTNAHIAGAAGIPDSKLAAPNNSIYRLIHQSDARGTLLANGTVYLLGNGDFTQSATAGTTTPSTFGFDDADYSSPLTTYLRLRVQLYTNATAPTSTFTFGLYPISTVGGTANNNSYTVGTVVTGSTTALAAPSASTRSQGVATAFAIPADGYYAIGVSVATTMVANSAISASGQVHTVHV